MVIVGTTLIPVLQQQVNAAIQLRSQHMDQENLCYRTNTCRQSDVGQNTLGNDNQVTGFADQSDNIQQSATIPTFGNNTTLTPTPTPTTTTLTVTKIVSGNTTAIPSQFEIHVTGNNPNPPNFAGSTTGIDVTLSPGAFNVTETLPTVGIFASSFIGDCSGTIAAGQHLSCTITNTALTTCEECFTNLLTQDQIRTLFEGNLLGDPTLTEFCASASVGPTEDQFRDIIVGVGVSVTRADELIACLKAAGIVFAT
jgi:hypothetical protein